MHLSEVTTYKIHILVKIQSLDFQLFTHWMPVSDSVTWLHLILSNSICRIEQTATVRVDNGPIVTGASPGKLRQLNGNGQLFIGKLHKNTLTLVGISEIISCEESFSQILQISLLTLDKITQLMSNLFCQTMPGFWQNTYCWVPNTSVALLFFLGSFFPLTLTYYPYSELHFYSISCKYPTYTIIQAYTLILFSLSLVHNW